MDIFINEEPADITLESEKTLGELVAGIEAWLAGSENRISGLRINGEPLQVSSLAEALEQDLQGIERLDITISAWPQLALEALLTGKEALAAYENLSLEERRSIEERWEEHAAAHFLSEHLPDLAVLLQRTFRGELLPAEMGTLLDERIREVTDPGKELREASTLISSIATRLEDLPLDIQTGKDRRAAETVDLFARTAEKLLRLVRLLQLQGFALESFVIDTLPFSDFINEFRGALSELVSAYENQDAVLVGDLAEYELSPRLLKLYASVRDNIDRDKLI
ncbi:MAG: hypothetical protein LBQ30_06510 [Treponema sp.]|jgi:hypothetical protein|nr:hypothetical protein [Treponema sp.]